MTIEQALEVLNATKFTDLGNDKKGKVRKALKELKKLARKHLRK